VLYRNLAGPRRESPSDHQPCAKLRFGRGARCMQIRHRRTSHPRRNHGRSGTPCAHAPINRRFFIWDSMTVFANCSPLNRKQCRRGSRRGAFSFNSGSGRCERCSGTGYEKIEMQFLSDLFVRCAECEGKRFQTHVLKVQVHGKSIHDLLKLTVSEAIEFFAQMARTKRVSETA